MTASARLSIDRREGATALAFAGHLNAAAIGGLWHRAIRTAQQSRASPLVIDLREVAFCDVAGATFLAAIEAAHGERVQFVGAEEHVQALLTRARAVPPPRPNAPQPWSMRDLLQAGYTRMINRIAFIGEASVALLRLPEHYRMLRLPDLMRTIDQAGVRSLPLVSLLGYLIGLILAFQSAIPMRRFGADIFVASLVALSLLRELGPLLAAVILAGRTGSAFAAEIGTMKVNEEIDALRTMGLDPMIMLVVPRVIAAMLVMPVMTLVLELAGLLGMTTVMVGFGFPVVTVATQVQEWVTPSDLYGGLFKAVCFGIAVASIGCRSGLGTGVGPRAVGLSTTAAVVGGIIATIALDGVFALIFYRLNM